jgi:hypothetical protein
MQIRQRALRAAALLGVLVATGASVMVAPVGASASSLAPEPSAALAAPDVLLPLASVAPLKAGPGVLEPEHTCAAFGDPGTAANGSLVRAFQCADVFVRQVAGNSMNSAYVQNEVYCEFVSGPSDGAELPCSGVIEQVGAGSLRGTVALPTQICGVILGHTACSTTGRTEHAGFAFNYAPGGMNAICSIWGESLRVVVVLPVPGHPRVGGPILATAHVNVPSILNTGLYCMDI